MWEKLVGDEVKAMLEFKEKDVVRIKPEWCDSESDKTATWIVIEGFDYTGTAMRNRYDIGLIMTEEERKNRPFGCVQTVTEEMIEKVG